MPVPGWKFGEYIYTVWSLVCDKLVYQTQNGGNLLARDKGRFRVKCIYKYEVKYRPVPANWKYLVIAIRPEMNI